MIYAARCKHHTKHAKMNCEEKSDLNHSLDAFLKIFFKHT